MNRAQRRRQQKKVKNAAREVRSRRAPDSFSVQQDPFVQQALGLAVQHHTAGRLPQAETLYQEVLQSDPKQPVALHLLGLIAHQGSNNARAVGLISQALDIDPDYAEAHYNLGAALLELGRAEEAAASYRQALAIRPDYVEALNNLGNVLEQLGLPEEAVDSYRQALAIKPDYFEAHNNLGNALLKLGKHDEAISSYRLALAFKPDHAQAHNNLGIAFRELGQYEEAKASYQKALAIEPDYAQAHYNLGSALHKLRKSEEAVASYHKALVIEPNYPEAHCNLVEALEKSNRTEALREAVTNAKRSCPGHPLLAIGEARLLKRDGDYAGARAVLEDVAVEAGTDVSFKAARAHLLGDLCDRLGDAEEAYRYFAENNLFRRDTPEAEHIDAGKFVARIDASAKRFNAGWIDNWQPLESRDGRPDPVFLVGFPRSGTTLLDTILRGHAAITVVEEMPTVAKVRKALERLPGGNPDGLAELDPDDLAELRRIYFDELDKHLEPADRSRIVVDKMPLNIVNAGLIYRIFPQARFLFALRHPCDCVLSCFMQDFGLNEAMVNFLDLENAARLYDKVMVLWQQYQDVLPLAVHTVRYESLVEGFEETLTPVFEFLGVDWDEGVRDYAETARRRGRIRTPSYNQVTQPLYTRASGRWERYREPMQPVLPVLLPWAERFGYGEQRFP